MKPLERGKISMRRGTPSDAQRAFHLLTLAFAVDPASRWFFPDAAVYAGCFGAYSEAYGGKAFECDSAFFAGDLDGVALWYPPGVEQEVDKIGEVLLANMTMVSTGVAGRRCGEGDSTSSRRSVLVSCDAGGRPGPPAARDRVRVA